MTDNINYVRLIGVESKETSLIESFLSVVSENSFILDKDGRHIPKIIFVDELFHSDSLEDEYPGAVIVILGNDHHYESDDYLNRPLKWSSFQAILDNFVIPTSNQKNAIGLTNAVEVSNSDEQENQILSVSEYSFSEFLVPEFSVSQAMPSVSVATQSQSEFSEMGTVIEEDVEIVEMAHSRVIAERALFEGKGLVLGPNIIFWENFDCLVTIKSRPVLYILSSTGSVYSEYDCLDWTILLKSKYARVYPLPKNWSAEEKLVKYPLSWLVWFSSIARSRGYLLKSIDKDGVYMINEWPVFDQVYNNNDHLRLCSLLYTAPYSLQDLVTKTGLKDKVITGFLNACEKQNLLKVFPNIEDALEKQKHIAPIQSDSSSYFGANV